MRTASLLLLLLLPLLAAVHETALTASLSQESPSDPSSATDVLVEPRAVRTMMTTTTMKPPAAMM